MEKYKRFALLSLLFWLQLFSAKAEAQLKFKALDSYDNVRVEVTLFSNGEYVLEESFLDGSYLKDTGIWKQNGSFLKLYSNKKTKREHSSLRFKARKKFKGEKLKIVDEKILFQPGLKRGSTKYFKSYRWFRTK